MDTASSEDAIQPLPEPVVPSKAPTAQSAMEPPPPASTTMPSPNELARPTSSPRIIDGESGASAPGPAPAFALPYRMVYAVATQDAILVYDTQQQTPLVVVSNLHFATFTDVTWYGHMTILLHSLTKADYT